MYDGMTGIVTSESQPKSASRFIEARHRCVTAPSKRLRLHSVRLSKQLLQRDVGSQSRPTV